VKSALLSVEIIVFCEDFFGLAVQAIHGRQIIGYGNSTNSGLLTSFFVGPLPIRVISVIRGQNFGCGAAALGNPRLK
jgi:hypothetical protein